MSLSKLILSTIVSLSLFVGGIIILLFSRIPFWSVFLGIGASQAGIVTLILTFEKLVHEADPDEADIKRQIEELQMGIVKKPKFKNEYV